jgi:hypothetical protein
MLSRLIRLTGHVLRGRWRRWLAVAGVVLVGLVAFGIWLEHFLEERAWRAACAEADRLDPGWRREELFAARPNPPDDRNAALRVRAAQQLLPGSWPNVPVARLLGASTDAFVLQQLRPEQVKAARDALDAGADALAQTRGLEDMPGGRLPREDSTTYQPPDLFGTLKVARLLGLSAVLQSEDGQHDAALDTCRQMLAVARADSDELILMGTLLCIAIQELTVRTLERALAQGEPGEAALAALQRSLEDDSARPVMLNALRAERAWVPELREGGMTRELADSIAPRITGQATIDHWLNRLRGDGWWKPLFSANVRRLTLLIEAEKARPDALLECAEELASTDRRLIQVFSDMRSYFVADFRTRALLRSGIVALAAERFRRVHGRWPASLEELVPDFLKDVPRDPFDGQPLRFRRLSDGVVVYSVGIDRTDDGGQVHTVPKVGGRLTKDNGVRLWDPDQRRRPPSATPPPRQN